MDVILLILPLHGKPSSRSLTSTIYLHQRQDTEFHHPFVLTWVNTLHYPSTQNSFKFPHTFAVISTPRAVIAQSFHRRFKWCQYLGHRTTKIECFFVHLFLFLIASNQFGWRALSCQLIRTLIFTPQESTTNNCGKVSPVFESPLKRSRFCFFRIIFFNRISAVTLESVCMKSVLLGIPFSSNQPNAQWMAVRIP